MSSSFASLSYAFIHRPADHSMPINIFAAALGVVLKQKRIHRKLSQAQVANTVGISESLYSRFEAGKLVPRQTTFVKLAELLKMDGDIAVRLESFRTSAKGSNEEDAGLPDEIQSLITEIRRAASMMPKAYVLALRKEIKELTN